MSDMSEWIKERRRIHNAANLYGQDEVRPRGSVDDKTIDRIEANNAFSNDAHNILPNLLTAVEKVLALHQPKKRIPFKDGTWEMSCEGCDTHITFTRWPCPTVRAIEIKDTP